MDIIFLV